MGVALRDIIAPYKHPAESQDLTGVASVDAFNALYQFLSIIRQPDGTPLMDKEGRITSHLSGIFFRTTNFLQQGIQPVWIFDGKPPELKARTIGERRAVREEAQEKWDQAKREGDTAGAFRYAMASSKLDDEVLSSARNLLDLLGIPVINAPSEGEADASNMVRTGVARYVASQDYDTLLFGAPLLVRNLTVSGKRRSHGRMVNVLPETVVLDDVLTGLNLTREELIDVAILVGTDFNEGAVGVGAKTALKKIKAGEFKEVVALKLPDIDPEPIRNFFLNPPVSGNYPIEWKKPDHDRIISFLCGDYGFSEDRINPVLEKISGRGKQRTLDSWF
ncbi:flap endonuclease-1 [Methanospirillum lacunae]|uniref:Flap endonuclease 1 n=1 Tax=Methanospirillum lacunae TaxID=668570 RepID=A0A2V2MQL8_9EURY|nr:flap endonuclease-1 [Methanospirillum lacunae]PWR70534.1 flap endonuclease-1 [Methanospirillum lacunae]